MKGLSRGRHRFSGSRPLSRPLLEALQRSVIAMKRENLTIDGSRRPQGRRDTYSYQLARLISSFVPGRRGVTGEEARAWVEDLTGAGRRAFTTG